MKMGIHFKLETSLGFALLLKTHPDILDDVTILPYILDVTKD